MLSSLARCLGLGSLEFERLGSLESGSEIPGFLAVLVVLAPGQAFEWNELRVEDAIACCLNMLCKEAADFYRFHSDRDQPDRICHRLAISTETSQLNRQHFICWLSEVAAVPDVAMTIAASLEELGVVDSATVQFGQLVTTIEGSLLTPVLGC